MFSLCVEVGGPENRRKTLRVPIMTTGPIQDLIVEHLHGTIREVMLGRSYPIVMRSQYRQRNATL